MQHIVQVDIYHYCTKLCNWPKILTHQQYTLHLLYYKGYFLSLSILMLPHLFQHQ